MKKPLISVIVPVYNVDKYLYECVDSILNQIYKNIEIILIDDGSTDNSPTICEEYLKKDNRIKVIHKKNGGLSSARNAGLDIAKGEYISFVDSDDFVTIDYIESLYNGIINNHKDISICGINKYYDKGLTKISTKDNVKLCLDKITAHKYLYIIDYYDVGMWNKLYNKKLFDDIRFPLNKKSEDIFIQYKFIEKSNGVYYNFEPKYYYRQRNNSITKSSAINYDGIEAIKHVINYYKDKGYEENVLYATRYLLFSYIGVYNACLYRTKNKLERKRIRKEALKIKNSINYKYLNWERHIQLLLFLYCIPIYNLFIKIYFNNEKYC